MHLSKITLFDEEGKKLLEEGSIHLPIKENFIIMKSKEYFNDPEPCIIHRTAVLNLIGGEISKLLFEYSQNTNEINTLQWVYVPQTIKDMLELEVVPHRMEFIII